MQKMIRGGRGVLVLAICLLMSLAFGGVVAYGAWGSGSNTLKVETGAEAGADIESASVQVDLYKVATAAHDDTYETYNYTLVEGFDSEQMKAAFESGDWATFADLAAAAATADGTSVKADKTNQAITSPVTGLEDGVYLVLPHGAGVDVKDAAAYSATKKYTFNPSIVALPTRDGLNPDGMPDSGYGSTWVDEATIVLKYEEGTAYGSLVIRKMLGSIVDAEPATFVFHVVGKDVDEYASVYVTEAGTTSTTLRHLPCGQTYTVTEQYSGNKYSPSSAVTVTSGVVTPDETTEVPVSVSFSNEPDGRHPGGGHGIENHFEYIEDTGGTAWSLTEQTGLSGAETKQ